MSPLTPQHRCKTVNNVIAHLKRLLPPEYELTWNRPSPTDELAQPNKFQTFKVVCVSNNNQIDGQVYPNDFHNPIVFELALNRPGVSTRKVRPKSCTNDLMAVVILIKKLVPCPCSSGAANGAHSEK